MTKNAAILDTKMAVTFELLALEQKGKGWMYDTFLCNLHWRIEGGGPRGPCPPPPKIG